MPDLQYGEQERKRARYARRACDKCKRRKLKCDGREPCHRCTSQSAICSYERQTSGGKRQSGGQQNDMTVQMRKMQSVLDDLVQAPSPPILNDRTPSSTYSRLGLTIAMDSTPQSRQMQRNAMYESASSPIRGPTSPGFTFDVVKRSFEERGFHSNNEHEPKEDGISRPDLRTTNTRETWELSPTLRNFLRDALWEMSGPEARRLIKTFASGPGLMYPVVDTESLAIEARDLFEAVKTIKTSDGREYCGFEAQRLLNWDLVVLKLVLAIAIVLEKKDSDGFAERLVESIQDDLWTSIWRSSGIKSLVHCILTAILHFHLDEETAAGRFSSMAARVCLELGLNRQQNIARSFVSFKAREQAIVCFWAAYMLDRRGSIGLGVPYVMQDSDIDTAAPKTTFSSTFSGNNNHEVTSSMRIREASRQYMIAMIKFTQISGEACGLMNKFSDRSRSIDRQPLQNLDYQVLQWHRSIPDSLQLRTDELERVGTGALLVDPSIHFLRVVLNARMNQLRNLIFRPILYDSSRIVQHPGPARTAVEVAKESVILLWTVNESTEILRSHPVFFKHFLVSAFGLLLLAMVNAWSELGQYVAQEFYLALELFKVMSNESPLVMRYAATIKGLEELAHRIGLPRMRATGYRTMHEQSFGNDFDRNEDNECGEPSASYEPGVLNNVGELDIRDEFANFFDLDAQQTSSFFDFPLGDMLSANVLEV